MIHNPLEHKGVCVVSIQVKTNIHFLNQGSTLNLKLTISFHFSHSFTPPIPPIPPIPHIPSIPPIPLIRPIPLIPPIPSIPPTPLIRLIPLIPPISHISPIPPILPLFLGTELAVFSWYVH